MVKLSKNCGIYKITSPTGRTYIGQSKDIKLRMKYYKYKKCKKQTRLIASLNKYGFDAHQFDILEYCPEEELNCSERFWQDEFDVIGRNGLNCVLTQCGEKRQVISEESKEKNRQKQIGKKQSKETLLKRSNSMKGVGGKRIRNKKTGEQYTCINEVAKILGITRNTLSRHLNEKVENTLGFEYVDEELRPKQLCYGYKDILILDLNTGVYYYSVKEASKKVRVCDSNFSRMLMGHIENTTSLIRC